MSVAVSTSGLGETPKIEWTPAQAEATCTTGINLLVSAGAGSGKTAVLAERCARLIVGEGSANGVSVENLLVVTFTDAAAGEMKQRIAEALRRRLAAEPANGWIQKQLALIDTAAICTLHSFCSRVLRRHFAKVDLDPLAPIMDQHEGELMRRDCTRQTLKKLFDEAPINDAVMNLSAAYGGNNDFQLLSIIESLNGFLDSLPDPGEWVENIRWRYECGDGLPEFWQVELVRQLKDELSEQIAACETALLGIENPSENTQKLIKWFAPYQSALESWLSRLDKNPTAKTLDELSGEIHEFEFENIPSKTLVKRAEEPEKSDFFRLQERLKSIRDKYFKDRLQKRYGQFTTADWLEGIRRTAPHVNTLLDVAGRVRDAYAGAKRELGVIDFADLEQFMLRLLSDEQNNVARQLRDQYEHVLVDEFQDISPIQARIIECVSRENDGGRPGNLFCVGDVKQSIYRFRLAEPQLFLQRMKLYAADGKKDGRAIDLQENFRTRHGIIRSVNSIFERLMAEDLGGINYDANARLKPGRKDDQAREDTRVELCVLEGARSGRANESDEEDANEQSSETQDDAHDWQQIEREAYVIARRIDKIAQAGTPFGHIVILLRSIHPRAAALIRALARLGIPAIADTAGGLFESLEIQDILALLSVLDNPRQDIPLATVLRSPVLGEPLSDDELVEIRACRRDVPFHEAVDLFGRSTGKSKTHEKVCSLLEAIDEFREKSRTWPLADLLWLIYEQSGYFAYVQGMRDGAQRRANLERLHEYARQFGNFQRQGLARFLEFISGMQDADKDLDPGSVSRASTDAVRVMTMHRSKGLEFPVVVVAELGKRFNLRDGRRSIMFDRQLGLGMSAVDLEKYVTYPTLPQRLVGEAIVSESLGEELRVLYVALTRARDRLILVGTGAGKHLVELRSAGMAGRTGTPGVLPLLERRTAQCPLDWIVDAIGCLSNAHALFSFDLHDWQDMEDWRRDESKKVEVDHTLEQLSKLGELKQRHADHNTDYLSQVRRRLTTGYAARTLTRVPAVAAASTLKRRWETRQDAEEPLGTDIGAGVHASRLRIRRPEFLAEVREVEATDRGTWTHEFLQRLDLGRPCDHRDLEVQLAEFVSSGLFTAEQAAEIDVTEIEWFFSTALGVALKDGGTRKYREWPFVIGVDPTRYDKSALCDSPEDMLLVRGIVDCMFNRGDGWEIIDYKTDAVDAGTIAQRAAEYRPQLDIYSEAVLAAFDQCVIRRALVFLKPRQIFEV